MSATSIRTLSSALKTADDKSGKYLTFSLGAEEYGLEIHKVREIIGYIAITAVPKMPASMKGVINLRGQVIPVVDLRCKFGMQTAPITDETAIIVVEMNHRSRTFNTGIIVDRVQEVLHIAGENIEDAPQLGDFVDTAFILGMGKVNHAVKILLDIEKVMGSSEVNALEKNAR